MPECGTCTFQGTNNSASLKVLRLWGNIFKGKSVIFETAIVRTEFNKSINTVAVMAWGLERWLRYQWERWGQHLLTLSSGVGIISIQ